MDITFISNSLGQGHPPVRYCFHSGASSVGGESIGIYDSSEITSKEMLKAMMAYIWPKEDAMIRKRVVVSLGLLVGAKTLNVCVPFLFKAAVDGLNVLNMNSAPETALALATSLLIGCNY